MMRLVSAVIGGVAVLLVIGGCWLSGDKPFDFSALPPTPPVHAEGERIFNANCMSCHGAKGAGTQMGPTLINKIYEPSHHSDAAFLLAVQRGVVPHHWRFGPMPAVPAVSVEQARLVTSYIRWIQRQAGID
jgi:mono/diheme cytochrome c family protein